jgi:tetratricopeptide (TPR) repeat protein
LRLRGELAQAREILEQAVRLNEETGDVTAASLSRSNIAHVLVDEKRYDEAIALDRAHIEICRTSDPPHTYYYAGSLTNLAAALGNTGRFDEAAEALRQAVPIRRAFNDLSGLANSLLNLGAVLWQAAESRNDRRLMGEALAALEEARDIYRDRLRSESGHARVASNLGEPPRRVRSLCF